MSAVPMIEELRPSARSLGSVVESLGPVRRAAVWLLCALAAAGLAAYAVYSLVLVHSPELDRLFEDVVFNGLIVAGSLLCLMRACWSPSERLAWLALAVGLGCWAIGSILYTLDPDSLVEASFPTLTDVFWLVYYPAGFVTLGLLVRARTRHFYLSMWLDGLIGALVVSALAAEFVLPSILAGTGGSLGDVLANTIYPLGDVLLIAFAIGVLALTGWRPGGLLAAVSLGFAMGAVADTMSLYWSALGIEGSAFFDLLWPASAVLLGCAAWQPTRPSPILKLEGRRLLVMPIAFALLALALLALHSDDSAGGVAHGLAVATLAGVIIRMALTFSESLQLVARSRREALTDALTDLGNRRRLLLDLDDAVRSASAADPWVLLLFDLNGFKRYNDTFGHPVGDALLARLGGKLRAAVGHDAEAYRLGGDEFCVLARLGEQPIDALCADMIAALSERGEGFEITTACGTLLLPFEADDPSEALRLADQRLYDDKGAGRSSSRPEQTCEVLIQLLREREPDLHEHLSAVAVLAREVGRRMGLEGEELDLLVRAAELHDVGKIAVPDAILQKPARLDPRERAVIERHTEVGDRILSAAAALRPVARLVRSSHERWDGSGYPDRLRGEEIPLAARVVAVCDAFDAMTSDRPYRKGTDVLSAIRELRLHSGTQFDPAVIDVFCDIASAQAGSPPRHAHVRQEVPA
jgi:two-component system cell cycle response regulator